MNYTIFLKLCDRMRFEVNIVGNRTMCNIRWPVRNNSVCFAVYGAMLTNSQVLRRHAEITLYAQVDVKAV